MVVSAPCTVPSARTTQCASRPMVETAPDLVPVFRLTCRCIHLCVYIFASFVFSTVTNAFRPSGPHQCSGFVIVLQTQTKPHQKRPGLPHAPNKRDQCDASRTGARPGDRVHEGHHPPGQVHHPQVYVVLFRACAALFRACAGWHRQPCLVSQGLRERACVATCAHAWRQEEARPPRSIMDTHNRTGHWPSPLT